MSASADTDLRFEAAPRHLVVVAAGTGGHVIPGLAVVLRVDIENRQLMRGGRA